MLRAYQRVPHVILRRNIISNLRLLGGLGRYSSTSTTQFLAQPVVANLVKGLTATQPSFGLSAEAIKVLRTPDEFYQTLLVSFFTQELAIPLNVCSLVHDQESQENNPHIVTLHWHC